MGSKLSHCHCLPLCSSSLHGARLLRKDHGEAIVQYLSVLLFASSLLELVDSRERGREYATLMAIGCSSVTFLSFISHFGAQ